MIPEDIEEAVRQIRATAKYGELSAALIAKVVARELSVQPRPREAVKAAKRKLHQVWGAYTAGRLSYTGYLTALRGANSPVEMKEACLPMLRAHQSTFERLPILEEFYAVVFASLPSCGRILDLACGLNPLCIPWMPLPEDCEYHASDISTGLASFLLAALPLLHVRGSARVLDLTSEVPSESADAAFLLKALPCLQQLEKSIGRTLLEQIPARNLVISYPATSIGGRKKGMIEFYRERFQELLAGLPWTYREFVFPSELLFVVDKGTRHAPSVSIK